MEGAGAIGAFMSLNIALNNASLLHLSLSFNQVIRASIPVVCAACAVVVENKVPSPAEAAGLLLVAAGVMATIAGSADKSKQRPDETIGVVFCVVATLSNALMMTFSGRIMGPERLNALYLTFYTSPVVLALLAPVSAGMEWERMVARLAMPAPNDPQNQNVSSRASRWTGRSCWDPPVTRRAEGRVDRRRRVRRGRGPREAGAAGVRRGGL